MCGGPRRKARRSAFSICYPLEHGVWLDAARAWIDYVQGRQRSKKSVPKRQRVRETAGAPLCPSFVQFSHRPAQYCVYVGVRPRQGTRRGYPYRQKRGSWPINMLHSQPPRLTPPTRQPPLSLNYYPHEDLVSKFHCRTTRIGKNPSTWFPRESAIAVRSHRTPQRGGRAPEHRKPDSARHAAIEPGQSRSETSLRLWLD